MTLFGRFKARFLPTATCPTPTPAPAAPMVSSPNTGPTIPAQRVRGTARMAHIDGATIPLPPVQSRYSGQRRDIKALNRNTGQQLARRGSTRSAVGL